MAAVLNTLDAFNPLYSLSGLIIGVLVGLTGVGGGALMTPLLVLAFGVAPTTAVGTDLLCAAITKSSGTLVHSLNGTVDWRITRRLAWGSVPATIVTLGTLSRLVEVDRDATNGVVVTALGVALLLTAAALLFRGWILGYLARHTGGLSERQTAVLTVTLGAFLGVLVSVSSVGAGAVGMVVLLSLYPRTPTARLVGSDIAHAVPLTLLAGIGHWFMGGVDWLLLFSLLIGSMPGIAVGSFLAARVPDRYLRSVLATVMAIVGVKLSF